MIVISCVYSRSVQINRSEFLCIMSIVLFSLALCLFVSVMPTRICIVYSAGTKVELHVHNNYREVKYFILSSLCFAISCMNNIISKVIKKNENNFYK